MRVPRRVAFVALLALAPSGCATNNRDRAADKSCREGPEARRVDMTGPEADGGSADPAFDYDAVFAVIEKNAVDVRMCFNAQIRTGDRTEGMLHVRITIDCAGRVTDVQVTNSPFAWTLNDCAVSAIKGWRFNPPQGADLVTFKWKFALFTD